MAWSKPKLSLSLSSLSSTTTTTLTTLTTLLTTLLPSPTLHLISPSLADSNKPTLPHPSTAYLDGIRGLAALTVYIQHYSAPFQPGLIGDENVASGQWSFFQYPIIRLFYSGSFAVALFFVISGFALSRKPLSLLYSSPTTTTVTTTTTGDTAGGLKTRQHESLKTLSSSTFRRGIRIYLPPIILITFTTLLTYSGSFSSASTILPASLTKKYNIKPPTRLPNFSSQLIDALTYIAGRLIYPAQWMREIPGTKSGVYGFHLWTIPIEFWASILVFVILGALVTVKRIVRNGCLVLGMAFVGWCGRWEVALFLAGALLADWDLGRGGFDTPSSASYLPLSVSQQQQQQQQEEEGVEVSPHWEKQKKTRRTTLYQATTTTLYTILCISGLYLGSAPEMNFPSTPGFHFLYHLHAREETWHSIGAILVIFSISRSPVLQSLLTLPITQYLGSISFGLYLVHVPILMWFGWSATPALWGVIGNETGFRYESGVVLGCLGVLGVVVWVADVFWRLVDGPSMRLGRVVEGWVRCR